MAWACLRVPTSLGLRRCNCHWAARWIDSGRDASCWGFLRLRCRAALRLHPHEISRIDPRTRAGLAWASACLMAPMTSFRSGLGADSGHVLDVEDGKPGHGRLHIARAMASAAHGLARIVLVHRRGPGAGHAGDWHRGADGRTTWAVPNPCSRRLRRCIPAPHVFAICADRFLSLRWNDCHPWFAERSRPIN